jgi:hypothetical protein
MFFFSPLLRDDDLGDFITYQTPQVDLESVRHHGVRRMDARSRYMTDPEYVKQEVGEDTEAQTEVYLKMAIAYRNIVRDLHCMNHLFLNGSITLNHSRPDIRIGSRIRIEQPGEGVSEMSAYVEGVQHNWAYGTGTRTSLTVSHGWQGTDRDYIDAFQSTVARFGVFSPKRIEGERDWDTMRETPLDPEARTASRFFGNNYANEGAGGRQSPTRKLTAEEKQQYAEDYGVEFFNALKLYREKEKAANASTQTSTASGASDPDVSDVGGAGFSAVEEICVERLAAETPAVMSLYPEDEQAKLSRWSTDSETPTKE